MIQNPPKKHNYIPEFLLDKWIGDDSKFERYDMPIAGKIVDRRVHKSRVGWELGLYSSPGDRRGVEWLESKIFQVIDDRAAPVLQSMVTEPSPDLSAGQRSAWTVFLRSLFHRTPENFTATISSAISMIDEALEEARSHYMAFRGTNDPSTFEEFKDSMTLEERRRMALKSLPDLIANPRLGQFFQDMPTRIFTLPDAARDFLLSDDPMVRTNGLKKEDGHLAIAISPRKLFVSAYRERKLDEIATLSPQDLVTQINTWTVESARKFVAARDKSQDRFIRNRFGKNPKPPLLRI